MNENDLYLLRFVIDVARKSRENGNHPFGALLVDKDGHILLRAENSVVTGKDCTGHAETNLMRQASQNYDRAFLATCTIYASTEPCAMCSGAIFWGNIRRVVYGLSEARLYEMAGDGFEGEALILPCRDVFANGGKQIDVIGPVLEEEAEKVHEGFWK